MSNPLPTETEISPLDTFNLQLLANTHPEKWQNPTPKSRYHLVVIGGGTAGLVAAAGAAGLGAKVALIEKNLMGGDCLNTGCVPSKALLNAARNAGRHKGAAGFGVELEKPRIDFEKVMERVRRVRAQISAHDSVERFTDLGIDVFLGHGQFEDRNTITVNGAALKFRRALIATGARAWTPPIPGLHESGFLTNETVFNLTELPRTMVVIGGGPIGCELGQALQRLGSEVTMLEMLPRLMGPEDGDAARIVEKSLRDDGVQVVTAASIKSVKIDGGKKVISYTINGQSLEIRVDEILAAVGRRPNLENLNLEKAGVKYDLVRGVEINEQLRTTNSRIYASGDVCLRFKFTHTADFASRLFIQNAFFFGRKKISDLTIPWCTYIEPEVAHVGLYAAQAEQHGLQTAEIFHSLKDVDRAVVDGDEEGFIKVLYNKKNGRILGATIVARHAGDMIGEVAVAMAAKMKLSALANVIHPYPTVAEAIRKSGDSYNRTRLTDGVKKFMKIWFSIFR